MKVLMPNAGRPYRVKYTRAEVEELLHLRYDEHRWYGKPRDISAPDDDMPRAKNNPAHSGGVLAELADINRAWSWGCSGGITRREGQALVLSYKYGMEGKEIAKELGVSPATVSRDLYGGVGKLLGHLNGDQDLLDYLNDEEGVFDCE